MTIIYLSNTPHDSFLSFTSIKRRSHKGLGPQRVLRNDFTYEFPIPSHNSISFVPGSLHSVKAKGWPTWSMSLITTIRPSSWCSAISPHNHYTVPGPLNSGGSSCSLQTWDYSMSCLWHVLSDRHHSHPFIGPFHLRGLHWESGLNPFAPRSHAPCLWFPISSGLLLPTKPRSISWVH